MEYVRDILNEELKRFLLDVRNNMVTYGKEVTGGSSEAFSYNIESNNEVLISGPANARSLQRGIRPGTWPKGYANIIRDWAIAKGLSFQTNEELERFAYAVANKIKQDGSLQYRTHTYYDIYDSPFEECMDRITRRLSSSYLDLIMDNIG